VAIPQLYDTTQLILMPQAPHTIHAYWDFSRGDLDKIKSKLGDRLSKSAYILRMHDVTDPASSGKKTRRAFDINVGSAARSWYINLWADHVSYCADIGVRTAAGRFYPLAHSNVVTTPRAGASGRSEVMWLEVRDKGRRQPFVLTLRSGPPAAAQAPARRVAPDTHPSTPPAMAAVLGGMAAAGNAREETARHAGPAAPATAIEAPRSEPHGADMTPASDAARAQAMGNEPAEVVSHGPLNLTLDEIVMRLFGTQGPARAAAAGDPAAAPAPAAGSPMPPSTSWGGASEWSAGGSEQRLGHKGKFFFEIDAELLVYGRTEPDAQVLLNNEPVLLRPDGSFSLRCALPDGTIPLDFSALSGRGDARRISTSVVRAPTQRES